MTSSSKEKSYFSSLFLLLLLLNSLLNKPINIFTSIIFFSLLIFFVYFIYNLFRCQCGLSYTAHSTASFQRMKGARGSSFHRWWWPVFCLSYPDILTRLLASTKNANLEWTQLNFLRFMSLQNLDFVLSLVSIHQFIVHEIENVKLFFEGTSQKMLLTTMSQNLSVFGRLRVGRIIQRGQKL